MNEIATSSRHGVTPRNDKAWFSFGRLSLRHDTRFSATYCFNSVFFTFTSLLTTWIRNGVETEPRIHFPFQGKTLGRGETASLTSGLNPRETVWAVSLVSRHCLALRDKPLRDIGSPGSLCLATPPSPNDKGY